MGEPSPWVKVPKGTGFTLPGVAVGATGPERIVSRLEGLTTAVHWVIYWVVSTQAPPSQGLLNASFAWNVYAVAADQRIVKASANQVTAHPGTPVDIFVHGQGVDAWELGISMQNPGISTQVNNVFLFNLGGIAYGFEAS